MNVRKILFALENITRNEKTSQFDFSREIVEDSRSKKKRRIIVVITKKDKLGVPLQLANMRTQN